MNPKAREFVPSSIQRASDAVMQPSGRQAVERDQDSNDQPSAQDSAAQSLMPAGQEAAVQHEQPQTYVWTPLDLEICRRDTYYTMGAFRAADRIPQPGLPVRGSIRRVCDDGWRCVSAAVLLSFPMLTNTSIIAGTQGWRFGLDRISRLVLIVALVLGGALVQVAGLLEMLARADLTDIRRESWD